MTEVTRCPHCNTVMASAGGHVESQLEQLEAAIQPSTPTPSAAAMEAAQEIAREVYTLSSLSDPVYRQKGDWIAATITRICFPPTEAAPVAGEAATQTECQLTDLQRAMIEHDDDMARMDRQRGE